MNNIFALSKAGKEYQEYLQSMTKMRYDVSVVKTGLIEWTDEPERWYGPFNKKYCFFRITDHSKETNIPNMATMASKIIKDVEYCVFNFPANIRNKYGKYMLLTHDSGTLCSRTQLTHAEKGTWEEEFKRKDLAGFWKMESKKAADIARRITEHHVTVETPIKFYMCGNDDCSYTKTFRTVEEAMYCLVKLTNSPSWDLLELFGFQFTN